MSQPNPTVTLVVENGVKTSANNEQGNSSPTRVTKGLRHRVPTTPTSVSLIVTIVPFEPIILKIVRGADVDAEYELWEIVMDLARLQTSSLRYSVGCGTGTAKYNFTAQGITGQRVHTRPISAHVVFRRVRCYKMATTMLPRFLCWEGSPPSSFSPNAGFLRPK